MLLSCSTILRLIMMLSATVITKAILPCIKSTVVSFQDIRYFSPEPFIALCTACTKYLPYLTIYYVSFMLWSPRNNNFQVIFRLLHMCVRLKNKRRKIIKTAHYDLQCASFVDILQPWMRTSQKI